MEYFLHCDITTLNLRKDPDISSNTDYVQWKKLQHLEKHIQIIYLSQNSNTTSSYMLSANLT